MRVRVTITAVLALAWALIAGNATATPTTGNVLVLLARGRAQAAAGRSAVRAAIARAGAGRAGFDVPQIGLITVRPPRGTTPAAFAAELQRLPGVAAAQIEHRYVPRAVPDDPALSAPDQYSGTVEWTLAREGFYNAWNISNGDGALVGVIDTGIDAPHPDLASKIAAAVDQQDPATPAALRGRMKSATARTSPRLRVPTPATGSGSRGRDTTASS